MQPPDYRTRLIQFYERHNPSKVSNVDKILSFYQGHEEELFTELTQRYGQEPWKEKAGGNPPAPPSPPALAPQQPISQPSQPSPSAAGAQDGPIPRSIYRDILIKYYSQHNPRKVGDVDQLLDQYKGQEASFWKELEKKYGIPPETPVPPQSNAPRTTSDTLDVIARIKRMYQKYNPKMEANADRVIAQYKGEEEKLLKELVADYGPEPAGPNSDSVGASNEQAFKDRLIRFYEHYKPEKVADVDKIVSKNKGFEPQIMAELVKRYGPEPQPKPTSPTVWDTVKPTPLPNTPQPQPQPVAVSQPSPGTGSISSAARRESQIVVRPETPGTRSLAAPVVSLQQQPTPSRDLVPSAPYVVLCAGCFERTERDGTLKCMMCGLGLHGNGPAQIMGHAPSHSTPSTPGRGVPRTESSFHGPKLVLEDVPMDSTVRVPHNSNTPNNYGMVSSPRPLEEDAPMSPGTRLLGRSAPRSDAPEYRNPQQPTSSNPNSEQRGARANAPGPRWVDDGADNDRLGPRPQHGSYPDRDGGYRYGDGPAYRDDVSYGGGRDPRGGPSRYPDNEWGPRDPRDQEGYRGPNQRRQGPHDRYDPMYDQPEDRRNGYAPRYNDDPYYQSQRPRYYDDPYYDEMRQYPRDGPRGDGPRGEMLSNDGRSPYRYNVPQGPPGRGMDPDSPYYYTRGGGGPRHDDRYTPVSRSHLAPLDGSSGPAYPTAVLSSCRKCGKPYSPLRNR
eukprot:PhF_6_TR1006/c0_g1_i3/m.2006